MTSINDLPETSTVSDGDKFPIWTSANGRTRNVSAYDLKTYTQADVTASLANLQAQINGLPATLTPNQGLTGSFWSDDVPPARINRFADRVLVGDAVVQNGAKSPGATRSWLGMEANGYMTYFDSCSQMEVVNTAGSLAIAVGTRTSDNTEPGLTAAIGYASYARNDSGNGKSAWAFYGHSRHDSGGKFTTCIELDIASTVAGAEMNPYLAGQDGTSAGIWLRSGGETAESGIACLPASVALAVVRTGMPNCTFNKGIVFQATAITGTDGVTGTAPAIEMAKGHMIRWVDNTGSPTATIYSNNTDATKRSGIRFETDAIWFTRNSNIMAVFDGAAGSGNYIQLSSASVGSTPGIKASGTDTNVDLLLDSKGTGRIQLRNGSTPALDANSLFISLGAQSGSAGEILRATRLAGSVNYINVTGGASGTNPALAAAGTDTNLDLALAAKGTGTIRFGTFTTNADAPITGYITIKDSGGTTRKLAVIA